MARKLSPTGKLIFLAVALLLPSQLWAAEEQLIGVRIGGSKRDLMTKFGAPGEFTTSRSGFLLSGAGGMIWHSRYRPTRIEMASTGLAAAVGGGLPWWAVPVKVAALGPDQEEWIYRIEERKVSAGFIIEGSGEDSVITDIIVAGFFPTSYVQTSRGIHLGSTFSEVLKTYGWPPRMEVYVETGGGESQGVALAGSLPAAALAGVGAMPGIPGMAGMPGMAGIPGMAGMPGAGASAGIPPQMLETGRQMLAQGSSPEQIAQMASQRGYNLSAEQVLQSLGGQAGVSLPPGLGAAAGGVARPGAASTQVVVDRVPIMLSRHAVLYYEGVAFTLHQLKVVRIHISE
jgi:hypothetical protein